MHGYHIQSYVNKRRQHPGYANSVLMVLMIYCQLRNRVTQLDSRLKLFQKANGVESGYWRLNVLSNRVENKVQSGLETIEFRSNYFSFCRTNP